MKIMKLNVSYYGNYGGDTDEYVLLPLDINGVLFEELEEKTYDKMVYLGEIAGKHSEVYGDLGVEIIDLEELSVLQISDLIKNSSFEEFASFFEGVEESFNEELEDEVEEFDYIEYIKPLANKYKVNYDSYNILTALIYDKFIEELKDKYVQKFKSISILEEDYLDVLEILKDNGIETFQ